MILTSEQTSTLLNALRVAGEQYRKDAAAMHAADQTRIAQQFDRQAVDAMKLCDLIEESSHIAIGGM